MKHSFMPRVIVGASQREWGYGKKIVEELKDIDDFRDAIEKLRKEN